MRPSLGSSRSHKRKTYHIPRELSNFFLYLWVVRGLSVGYAAKLTRALLHEPTYPNARTARRYFEAFETEHWVFEEVVA